MRPLILAILMILCSFQSKGPAVSAWTVDRSSTLAIDGSSNVTNFTCDVTEYLRADTLKAVQELGKGRYLFTTNSSLQLEIRRFDCHNRFITSDFRKMLKSESHPCIMIRFLNLDEFQPGSVVKGQVMVELAGKRKVMDISYNCTQPSADLVRLQGVKTMKFSDFELEAPKKIAGLIRINEEIKVNFNLNFRKLHS